jgi:hypothetical protein
MSYKTQSVDTSPEAEKVYFDLLRRAGTAKRYERMTSWSDSIIGLSRLGIANKHPDWSQCEVRREWARQQYGEELVSKLLK